MMVKVRVVVGRDRDAEVAEDAEDADAVRDAGTDKLEAERGTPPSGPRPSVMVDEEDERERARPRECEGTAGVDANAALAVGTAADATEASDPGDKDVGQTRGKDNGRGDIHMGSRAASIADADALEAVAPPASGVVTAVAARAEEECNGPETGAGAEDDTGAVGTGDMLSSSGIATGLDSEA